MAKTDYVTKADLEAAFNAFGEKFSIILDQKLDQKLDEKLDEKLDAKLAVQTELIRDEMDSKLRALENRFDHKLDTLESRLKKHTETVVEEVVGTHKSEVLDTISSVVEPIERDTEKLKKAVFGA